MSEKEGTVRGWTIHSLQSHHQRELILQSQPKLNTFSPGREREETIATLITILPRGLTGCAVDVALKQQLSFGFLHRTHLIHRLLSLYRTRAQRFCHHTFNKCISAFLSIQLRAARVRRFWHYVLTLLSLTVTGYKGPSVFSTAHNTSAFRSIIYRSLYLNTDASYKGSLFFWHHAFNTSAFLSYSCELATRVPQFCSPRI